MTALVLRGDARHLPLPDASVDLVVTSPPFYSLRSYTDGGQHYDGQIGSEPTPAEYIDELIDCTREWIRVLKPTGSLFVDLGDSYAGPPTGPKADYAGVAGRGVRRPGARSQWTNANAAWLAAVLDCEGSVSGRIFTSTSGRESFVVWMRVGMMDREVVERIYEVTGVGRVFQDGRGVWNYHVAAQAASYVLARIWPWLRIKQRRALTAIELCRHVEQRAARGRRMLTADDLSYRAKLVGAIRDWNAHPARRNDYVPPTPRRIWLPDHIDPTPAKSLRLLPERYRIACVDHLGLIARAVVIWDKPNPIPDSATDRVGRSHEDWVHLTKQGRYYSAVDAIRERHSGNAHPRGKNATVQVWTSGKGVRHRTAHGNPEDFDPRGKLPGSVWRIATQPLIVPEHLGVDHWAAYPTAWPRQIIQGWSPSGICTACDEARRPVVVKDRATYYGAGRWRSGQQQRADGAAVVGWSMDEKWSSQVTLTDETCACPEPTAPTRPAVVLDPFGGTGTTALVASVLGRVGITVDRSWDYCRLAAWRTTDPGQRAAALQVDKPPKPVTGQLDLFANEVSA
jgi:SAM-dependent methyltransferase